MGGGDNQDKKSVKRKMARVNLILLDLKRKQQGLTRKSPHQSYHW